MFQIIGVVMVFVCVFVTYAAIGGKLTALWVPGEYVIIAGTGLFAMMISNPKRAFIGALKGIGKTFKGPQYKKADYLELLSMQYQVYKLMKQKGALALEQHVENAHDSTLFQNFPKFHHDHHALEFFCDYLRLMTLGTDNPHEVEGLMDAELEKHHHEEHASSHALQGMAESFPGIGIVAAVLGIIKTMGYISEPPEILGGLIASALVGTFLGIFLCYGIFGPIAACLKSIQEEEHAYFMCMKAGLVAHLQGYAPAVSTEFARKGIPHHLRPTFLEVEEAVANLPPA